MLMYCFSKSRPGQIVELLERSHSQRYKFSRSRMGCKGTSFEVLILYNHIRLVYSLCSFGHQYADLFLDYTLLQEWGETSVHMDQVTTHSEHG